MVHTYCLHPINLSSFVRFAGVLRTFVVLKHRPILPSRADSVCSTVFGTLITVVSQLYRPVFSYHARPATCHLVVVVVLSHSRSSANLFLVTVRSVHLTGTEFSWHEISS